MITIEVKYLNEKEVQIIPIGRMLVVQPSVLVHHLWSFHYGGGVSTTFFESGSYVRMVGKIDAPTSESIKYIIQIQKEDSVYHYS